MAAAEKIYDELSYEEQDYLETKSETTPFALDELTLTYGFIHDMNKMTRLLDACQRFGLDLNQGYGVWRNNLVIEISPPMMQESE
jgi:hypothetical protein